MTLHALIAAMACLLGHKAPPPRVVDAIAAAVATDPARELSAALLTVSAAHESGFSERPRPWSWDAKAGVSCGVWQEPCAYVRSHTLDEQAKYFLRLVHEGEMSCPAHPLAPALGGCGRAARPADRRMRAAKALLARVEEL